MKYLLALFTLIGAALTCGCSPKAAAPRKGDGEVRLAPVIRVKSSGPFSVPLCFSNGSDKPFSYSFAYGEIAGLEYSLHRDGKAVKRDLPAGGPIPNPVYTVKTLKPNESLTFSYKLDGYSKLKAGEYDLKIIYRVHKGSTLDLKYNVTPADFTLSYTLIVE